MSWTKVNLIIIILFIIHLVGGVALSIDSVKSIFLYLRHLILHSLFGLLIWGNDDFSINFSRSFLSFF